MTIFQSTDALVAPFRVCVDSILDELRDKGLNPKLSETWRNDARQKQLANDGYSDIPRRGMHYMGAAADIIDAAKGWDAEARFWNALGTAAHKRGLCWGGDWKTPPDKAHVQFLPVLWVTAPTLDKLRPIAAAAFPSGPAEPEPFFDDHRIKTEFLPMLGLMRLYDVAKGKRVEVFEPDEIAAIANVLRPLCPK